VEFTLRLESFRGKGPNICVKKGYAAFKGSYGWSDLGTIETYPVMDTDAVLKLVGQK
jgi:hypothetical protein